MPDRILRSAVIGSEKMAKVCDQAALLFDRILLIADDFGILELAPMSLKMRAVPGRDSYTINRIEECCAELVSVGLLRAYTNDGKQYAAISKWEQTRWSKASKLPIPPWGEDHIVGGYIAPRARKKDDQQYPAKKQKREPEKGGSPATETGGNGGSGFTPGFLAFWNEFPKKVSQMSAWKQWLRINPSVDLQARIMDALRKQKAAGKWTNVEERYKPHPDKWLENSRWNDEIEPRTADANVPYVHDPGKCAVCKKSLANGYVLAFKGRVCQECKNAGLGGPDSKPIQTHAKQENA